MSFALRLIILILFLVLVEFYVVRKGLRSIKVLFPTLSRKKIKLTAIIGLTWFNLYPLAVIITWTYARIAQTESIAQPDSFFYEYLILYPFWIWIIAVIQVFVILIPADLIKLFLFIPLKKGRDKIRLYHMRLVFVVMAAAAVYVPARIIYDLNSISTRIVEYKKGGLPEALDGFRLTFISDVQADQFTTPRRLQDFIDKVNDTNPDLVLIGGDIITGTSDYLNISAEYLGKIKSKYGVYSCVGDHDNWMYRREYERSVNDVTKALESVNVKMIDNDKVTIDIDTAKVRITFITNTYVERIDSTKLDSLTNHSAGYDLKIFLTHQPREYLINEAHKKDYDLMLVGHTHGGQITILFPFYNFAPTLIETEYVKGDFRFGDMLMIVNRGLGVSLSPVRYNSTPEITLIGIESE